MRQLFCSKFINLKITLLEISEKVSSTQVFHDNVDIVLIFENIKETDYKWMLAHLQDFDLPSLELHVLDVHLFFGHNFYGNLLLCFLVDGRFDESKLTFA